MLHDTVLIRVFARAPVAARCKTRLIPAIGARGAARVQQQLCRRTLATATATGLPVELWTAPDSGHPLFTALRRQYGIALRRQPRGDLGHRMAIALSQRPPGVTAVLVIGTDAPGLTVAALQAAARALQPADRALLLLAADGGFVAIGSRRAVHLRAVAWSSGREAAQTLRRLRQQGLDVLQEGGYQDLDEPADLRAARRAGQLPRV
ncbi:TIGR04282 family arsenosugar biosynthesis glycosyltransferase [Flagellatimonas centrodinii]|uniref:TIGR04282 family arsenosugar biosynthesis glycosyltransferase n=1 Tax=Flagellatimonas centrodinii TaxID=2806210 RepID=UPI001FEF972C|nr:TIGR04282 family arsenosugar biosynthesis glycosyltransferase [Flagellatimonas centrodinii]ULQ46546.1 TIGR04282 family arsenosugar biosynthesis glycosyltransferase [Flagellatimonas centrodinii]